MKALVKKESAPGLWLLDVPVPQIKPNEVLIKIRKTAICGTDRHIYDWDPWAAKTIPVPLTIGHECMGEIVEIGREVHHLNIGQRVAVEGHFACGHCVNCRTGLAHLCLEVEGLGVQRPGAFAEYLAMPAFNVIPLPDQISDESAAVLDPFGNAVHALMSFEATCRDILITGAGPIGLMAILIAKKIGVRSITVSDVNPFRLKLAEKLGADAIYHPDDGDNMSALKQRLGMKEGFDLGYEMAGHPAALSMLLEHIRHGGRMVLMGVYPNAIPVDVNVMIFKGLRIKGIYGREMFRTWYQALQLLQTGLDITPVISHQFPYFKFEEAFAALKAGDSAKVVLDWS